MKNTTKILTLLSLTVIIGLMVANTASIISHALHLQNYWTPDFEYYPIYLAIGLICGGVPAFVLFAAILFPLPVLKAENEKGDINQAISCETYIFTPVPVVLVGQEFAGIGCRLRVKHVKVIDWGNADLSGYEYAYNFSL